MPYNSCRFYSSNSDGRNASEEGKHSPTKEATKFDEMNSLKENALSESKNNNQHALLGEHDQLEWLNSEKLSIESKEKESPFLTRRQRLKNEFLRRVVSWEKIRVTWKTFPYYIK